MNKLYPVDIMVYNHIKFFTEKGELKCCCQSNDKISQEVGRHKTNISRSISKLNKLGYINIDNSNGRKLSSNDKIMSIKYENNVDNLAMGCDKIAMLIDILAMPFDKIAMDKLIKSLRGVDNLAKHNIDIKLRLLNLELNRKTKNKYPTIEEVKEYATTRDRLDIADRFFDYFNATNWVDSKGNEVKNWKAKFVTWETYTPKPENIKRLPDPEPAELE